MTQKTKRVIYGIAAATIAPAAAAEPSCGTHDAGRPRGGWIINCRRAPKVARTCD